MDEATCLRAEVSAVAIPDDHDEKLKLQPVSIVPLEARARLRTYSKSSL